MEYILPVRKHCVIASHVSELDSFKVLIVFKQALEHVGIEGRHGPSNDFHLINSSYLLSKVNVLLEKLYFIPTEVKQVLNTPGVVLPSEWVYHALKHVAAALRIYNHVNTLL